MTPEQEALTKAITRLMRMGGKLFLLFWLLTCGAMAIIAVCALLGVPEGAIFSGTPLVWACVLLGSIAAAGLGWLFMRLWRRALDSFGSHIPAALPTNDSGDRQDAADITDARGISTSTHIGLQFVLTFLGGLVGLIVYIVFFRNSFASQLLSGIVFALTVGIGTVTPKLVMFLIPARCPKCSGRSFFRGSNPITFVCRNCNHIHNTGLSMGAGDSHT